MAKAKPTAAPVVVIFGDEEYQKASALRATLESSLPPEADRRLALSEFDGTASEDQGGPSLPAVMDDLSTLPFLTPRRIVLIRDADRFITQHRARLESYLAAPSPTGTLVLVCRAFPKTTKLYKAAVACGGCVYECRKLSAEKLSGFVLEQARALGKHIDPPLAGRLVELVGASQGGLAGELEKLALYVGARPSITADDIAALVGQSREEMIFAVMDAAGSGRVAQALQLWRQVLATDPAAPFKAIGGMAFKVRGWLAGQRARAQGASGFALVGAAKMWGRSERDVEQVLRRLPAGRLRTVLGRIADVDAQAKSGARSIETGIERVLLEVAAAAD